MSMKRLGPTLAILLCLAALAALPELVSPYAVRLTAEILIYALLAMSLDLALGYTGMPSLGHAAFYGVGAYAAGYLAKSLTAHALVTLPAAMVAAALVALVIGFFSVRTRGIYFLMLTLAFGQMLKAIGYSWKLTGGPDGLASIPRPLLGLEEYGFSLMRTANFYYLVLACFVLAFLFLRSLTQSPLGRGFVGIRENERRMRAIGYDPFRGKLIAFTISGSLAGLAGALHAHLNGFTSSGELDWSVSATLLVMVIIGGAGTLIGPIFGAAVFVLIQNRISSMTPYWHMYLGLLFVIFVLSSRQGLAGIASALVGRWRRVAGKRSGTLPDGHPDELRRAEGAL